ncbi:MAG: hypothetical protein Alpg2KO_01160 [Alphaproteobacteria bacterium]
MSDLVFAILRDKTLGNAHDFRLLLALANCVRSDRGYAWPSIDWLVENCAMSRRTVIAGLKRLEAEGRIRVERTARTSRYFIPMPAARKGCSIDTGAADAPQQDDQSSPTGAVDAQVQEMHGCSSRTGAADARVQQMHQRGAADAPQGVQQMHPIRLGDKTRDKTNPPPEVPQPEIDSEAKPEEVDARPEPSAASNDLLGPVHEPVPSAMPVRLEEIDQPNAAGEVPLPLGWTLPEEWRCAAASKFPQLDLDLVAENFATHWQGKRSLKGGRKANWRSAWLNECSKVKDWRKYQLDAAPGSRPSPHTRLNEQKFGPPPGFATTWNGPSAKSKRKVN